MLTAGPGLAGAGRVFCGCCASGLGGGKGAGPGGKAGSAGVCCCVGGPRGESGLDPRERGRWESAGPPWAGLGKKGRGK